MGSELGWRRLSADTFEIKVTVYRDCNGSAMQLSSPIRLTPLCGISSSIALNSNLSAGVDITPLCNNSKSRCYNSSSSFGFGIEKYEIKAIVDLSKYSCCEFRVSWSQCCRNNNITTGPFGNSYVDAQFNKCIKGDNSSPVFLQDPINIFCKNQCVSCNPGAIDRDKPIDGKSDSLIFYLVKPKVDATNTVNYIGNFNYKEPLQYKGSFGNPNQKWDFNNCNGFHLDSSNGDLRFNATRNDITVLSYIVEEWKFDSSQNKRIKSGYLQRDIQLIITDCKSNAAPFITSTEIQNNRYTFCAEREQCFTISTFDANKDDTVSVSTKTDIPGVQITVDNNRKWGKVKVCWNPKITDIRNTSYKLIVNANDGVCPLNARTSQSFDIYVKKVPKIKIKKSLGNCGEVVLEAENLDSNKNYVYLWNVHNYTESGNKFSRKFKNSGTYPIKLRVSSPDGCDLEINDSITVNPYVNVFIEAPKIACYNQNIRINTTKAGGLAPFLYEWSLNPGKKVSNLSSVSLNITQDTMVWVKIYDQNGFNCWNIDSVFIKLQQQPEPSLGDDVVSCFNKPVVITPTDKNFVKYSNVSFQWIKDDNIISKDSTISINNEGKYVLRIIDSVGCEGLDTIQINFTNPIQSKSLDTSICFGESLNLTVGADTLYYEWIDLIQNKKLTKIENRLTIDSITQTLYKFAYSTSGIFGNNLQCRTYDTIVILGINLPRIELKDIPDQCTDNSILNLSSFTNLPNSIFFVENYPNAVINGNLLNPRLLNQGTYKLINTAKNQNGCIASEFIEFEVDTVPNVVVPEPQKTCISHKPIELIAYPMGGIWNGNGITKTENNQWYFNPSIAKEGEHIITYTYKDNIRGICDKTVSTNITVVSEPIIRFQNINPICQNLETYPLTEVEPKGGTWFYKKQDGIIDNNILIPNKLSPGYHWIYYSYTKDDVCTVIDSTQIQILQTPIIDVTTHNNQYKFCENEDSVLIVTNSNTNGVFAFSGNAVNNNVFSPKRAGAGVHKVIVHFIAKNGCIVNKTLNIEVQKLPKIVSISQSAFCYQDTIPLEFIVENTNQIEIIAKGKVLSTSDFNKFLYIPTSTEKALRNVNIEVFTKTFNNNVCQEDYKQFTVELLPKPLIELNLSTINACVNQPIEISLKNNKSAENLSNIYIETDGNIYNFDSDNIIISYKSSGNKTLKVFYTYNQICDYSETLPQTISIYDNPKGTFSFTPGNTSILQADVDFEFISEKPTINTIWKFRKHNSTSFVDSFFNLSKSTYKALDTGYYDVNFRTYSLQNCILDTTIIKAFYIKPELTIYIPNVFSPNNLYNDKTKVNEEFKPIVEDAIDYKFSVFNQWGQLMFETTDTKKGWDGNFKGVPSQEGLYLYVVVLKNQELENITLSGTVKLIR